MPKHSKKKIVLGAVALVVLALSLLSIRSTLTGKPFWPWASSGGISSILPSSTPSADDVTLRQWCVEATPIVHKSDAPTIGVPGRNPMWGTQARFDKSGKPLPPPKSEELPAVQVSAELELVGKGTAPSVWPKITAVELLRAASSNGVFAVVRRWDEPDLKSPAPLTVLRPGEVIDKKSEIASRHRVTLVDTQAERGAECWYKVRLFHGRKVIGESGPCSTVALELPAVEARVDADGFPNLSWQTSASYTARFVTGPKLIVAIKRVYELARWDVASGSFKLPVRHLFEKHTDRPILFSIEARIHQTKWDSKRGPQTSVPELRLERAVELPPSEQRPADSGPGIIVSSTARDFYGVHHRSAPADSGILGVFWVGTTNTPPRLLERRGATVGTARRVKNKAHYRWEHFYESPGPSERCEYVYEWDHLPTSTAHTARVWAVRSPLPQGLVAAPGEHEVRLAWDKLAFDPKDWIEGPQFVVRRCDETQTTFQDSKLQANPTEEIYRGNAAVTEYADRNVKVGTVYFYTLWVEGVSRAVSWNREVGEYPCNLPVRVRMPTGVSGYPVIALPSRKRPLRVSLLAAENADARINSAQAHFLRALRDVTWIEFVERAAAASLLGEKEVSALATGDSVESEDFKRAMTADVVLRCKPRQVGYRAHLDVWMEDFRNSRRERLLTAPLDDLDLDKTTSALLQEITRSFPSYAGALPPKKASGCALVRVIALAGFLPLSKSGLAQGGVEDILTVALTTDECLKVVEREKIGRMLQEMGLSRIADQESALQLGKLLEADAVVTGFYGIEGKQITLSARLVDVGSGNLIKIIDLAGPLQDLSALGKQLALEISTASKLEKQASDSPLMRWIESRTFTQAESQPEEKLKEAKTATYLSPETPGHHLQMGEEYKRKQQYEEALASFYNGMTVAEKKEDPWVFYTAAAEILQILKRPEEEVALWKRAVADREKRKADADAAYLNLARRQFDLKKNEETLASLARIRKQTYESGRVYEQLNRRDEAVRAYAENLVVREWSTQWIESDRLGPGYAALIRLLQGATGDQRAALLRSIADKLGNANHPYQALKATEELLRVSGNDLALLLKTVDLAAQLGDDERAVPVLTKIVEKHPNTVECMRALSRLASIERRRGNAEKSKQHWQTLRKQKVKGHEADTLRSRAEMVLNNPTGGGISQPSMPQASPTVTNDPVRIPSTTPEETGIDTGGVTYSVTENGTVLCRDKTSKQAMWSYDLRPRRPYATDSQHELVGHWMRNLTMLANSMVLDGGVLLVPNLIDGVLHALDKNSGKRLWAFSDWSPISKPLIVGDRIYVGNSFGDLLELSRRDGQLVRTVKYPLQDETSYRERLFFLMHDASKGAINFMDIRQFKTEAELKQLQFRPQHSVMLDNMQMNVPGQDTPKAARTVESLIQRIRDLKEFNEPPPYGRGGPTRRAEAISELRKMAGREAAVQPLLEIVPDKRYAPSERVAAVEVLAGICGSTIVPRLVERLGDRFPQVRGKAAELIGTLGNDQHVDALVKALDDAHIDVRRAAMNSLLRIQGLEAKQRLQPFLTDVDSPLRGEAALGLYLAGDATLLSILQDYYSPSDFEWNDRPTLLFFARCKAGDPVALAELERRLNKEHEDRWVRAAMERIATLCPDRSLIPRLTRGGYAAHVATALTSIGDPAVVPYLLGALPDWTGHGIGEDGWVSFEGKPIVAALETLTGQSFGHNKVRWQLWWQTKGKHLSQEGNP